jgi:16S rRNA G1207 methylase RsmC
MTLTEINHDSLSFARANALLNKSPELDIVALDWNNPKLEGEFDYIVGSEIAYKKASFTALQNLFDSFLAPNGEIILTAGVRETSIEFFKQMEQKFHMRAQKKMLRSEDEQIPILQCRLTRK